MGPARPIAVFGYGSLVSARSAAATLGRSERPEWAPGEASVARLVGWRRRFSQARDNRTCEKTFALERDGSVPPFVLGLNVERTGDRDDCVNGMLIAVSEEELARLDVRELRYDRIAVGPEIEPRGATAAFEQVIVYAAKRKHLALDPPAGAVVLRAYVDAVEAAFETLGAEQLDAYRSLTGPPPVEVVDARLLRERIPPGNPRGW